VIAFADIPSPAVPVTVIVCEPAEMLRQLPIDHLALKSRSETTPGGVRRP
jgi:hypothetical protein